MKKTLIQEFRDACSLCAEDVHASVTANSCGTRSDRDQAHEADIKFEEAREAFEGRLAQLEDLARQHKL